jgi:hypothetical protein
MKIFYLFITSFHICFCALAQNDTKIVSSSNKVVTLTVTGQAKTSEEAKQNALRNAIEQAFGAFISSNTTILNDSLVKDQVVSVSNGNIQNYEVVSEVQIPNIGYATTLKATVSIEKLISFIESKGGEIEFKGNLFAFNVKQQILNEKNEQQAILDLIQVSKEIINKSFDYDITVDEPKSIGTDNQEWNIKINLFVKANENLLNMYNHLTKNLEQISMSDVEVKNYLSLNKDVFTLELDKKEESILQDKYPKSYEVYFEVLAHKKNMHEILQSIYKWFPDIEITNDPNDAQKKIINAVKNKFNESRKIYLRSESSIKKIILDLTTEIYKSMLSVKISDMEGINYFSPDFKTSEFISSILPMKSFDEFKYSEKNIYKKWDFREFEQFLINKIKSTNDFISLNNDSGGRFLLSPYINEKIATFIINKSLNLNQINQLSGFKVIKN